MTLERWRETLTKEWGSRLVEFVRSRTALHVMPTHDRVVPTCVFLAFETASGITFPVLKVDYGVLRK